MFRSRFLRMLGGVVTLATALAPRAGWAATIPLGSPAEPLPAPAGTGLVSTWATSTNPLLFQSLDLALTALNGPTVQTPAGPVNFSNLLKPIGDFMPQEPMPYSPEGTPSADGQYVASRMVGAWAARSAGTFTLAVGCDDGFRLTLGGAIVLNEPDPSSFARYAVTVDVAAPGLYPVELDYFNGIQEGAIELAIAPGTVVLSSPTAPLPTTLALVPKTDLYPLSYLDSDAGAPPATDDAGAGADAEAAEDARAVYDAAPDGPSDAGTAAETGTIADAGSPAADASTLNDAALVAADSGVDDGGIDAAMAALDAGTAPDVSVSVGQTGDSGQVANPGNENGNGNGNGDVPSVDAAIELADSAAADAGDPGAAPGEHWEGGGCASSASPRGGAESAPWVWVLLGAAVAMRRGIPATGRNDGGSLQSGRRSPGRGKPGKPAPGPAGATRRRTA